MNGYLEDWNRGTSTLCRLIVGRICLQWSVNPAAPDAPPPLCIPIKYFHSQWCSWGWHGKYSRCRSSPCKRLLVAVGAIPLSKAEVHQPGSCILTTNTNARDFYMPEESHGRKRHKLSLKVRTKWTGNVKEATSERSPRLHHHHPQETPIPSDQLGAGLLVSSLPRCLLCLEASIRVPVQPACPSP